MILHITLRVGRKLRSTLTDVNSDQQYSAASEQKAEKEGNPRKKCIQSLF